jgi:flagellar motor switch protein FliM
VPVDNEERLTQPGSVTPFDFRRPGAFRRETVRGLAAVHELFSRRISTGWGAALRSVVQVEEVAVDQATFGDYLASMPSPNAMATVWIKPLPGHAIIELSVDTALALVDRLLGSGLPSGAEAPRRLTDVETALLRHLLVHAVEGVQEALEAVVPVESELVGVDYNPQLVQVAAPSDRVVLLTYRISITQGASVEGLLTLCYPAATITPVVDRIAKTSSALDDVAEDDVTDPAWESTVAALSVELSTQLNPTAVPATDLAALQVGDVLRLDHRIDQPATVRLADTELLHGHLGRRGRRLAIQVQGELKCDPLAASELAGGPR